MASPALTLAAQTNGRKSQGPNTPEGKRKSAANSRKHGFYGKTIRHDAECEADYQRLLACIVPKYQANTPETRTLADTLALALARQSWALRTIDAFLLRAMEDLSVPGGSFKPGNPGHPGVHAIPLLHRLFGRFCRQENSARRQLMESSKMKERTELPEHTHEDMSPDLVEKCRNEPNPITACRPVPQTFRLNGRRAGFRPSRRGFMQPGTVTKKRRTGAFACRKRAREAQPARVPVQNICGIGRCARNAARRGSALLTVLWLTAALAAIGLAVANNVRGETERSATNVDDAKSSFVARGAIERALLHMYWGTDFYKPGQPTMDFTFPGAEAHVEIVPESAKLSANYSRPEELVRLLIALGQPEDKAMEIAMAIVDWRTPQPIVGQGPLDAFYLSQTPSFLPRHASFVEDEELLQVKGVTPDLYFGTSLDGSRAGLRDCLSAYAAGGPVDINTARAESMIGVGLAPEDAAAIVRNRAGHAILDFQELASIQQSLGPAGLHLRIGGNSMFTLRATARLRQPDGRLSDMRRTVAALVKRWDPDNKLNKDSGFEIVRWYDRT